MTTVEPLVVRLAAPLTRAQVPQLCEHLQAQLELTGAAEVVLDVLPLHHAGQADFAVIDALARLRLTARRAGVGIRVRDPGPGLVRLLQLTGLAETLGVAEHRGREPDPDRI
ncbi:STAS domain-containing protein [Streptomyces sp. TRM66268-LWL]|uniref:STAS domain-containing protein n=1 Tax=Streptomyces polyasparticus TaxID=2767826 RepID=A0ABR7SS38_9ACTN|nr:STAS domain-containing protein [Streptomyces polyasparticus]MBC9717767.1 STAS domain-containing protein [Streptomyces polyasparticus]